MNGGGGPGSTFGSCCSCNKGAFSLVSGGTAADGAENPRLSAIFRESLRCNSNAKSCDMAQMLDVIGEKMTLVFQICEGPHTINAI